MDPLDDLNAWLVKEIDSCLWADALAGAAEQRVQLRRSRRWLNRDDGFVADIAAAMGLVPSYEPNYHARVDAAYQAELREQAADIRYAYQHDLPSVTA
jgi:hypothetical protein